MIDIDAIRERHANGEELYADVGDLLAEVERLRAVVEYYADRRNDGPLGPARAREALGR